MDADPNADALHPSLVLGAWAEALIRGRRVAVIGDTTTGLAERLAVATSRKVHAYDPNASRLAGVMAARPSESVSYAPLSEALDVRGGAFDAVIVPDVTLTGDAATALDAAQALLSARGLLLVASPNPDVDETSGGPGYYELYDLVSARFDHLRVLGQAPFSAYSVAEFAADGDPNVTIDTSLGGEEEPHWFVVAASQNPIDIEPYTLVQIPSTSSPPSSRLDTTMDDERGALAEARLHAAQLDAEIDKLRDKERRAHELAEERKAGATKLAARLAELEAELERVRSRANEKPKVNVGELEDARRRAEDRVRTLEKRVAQQHRDFDRATQDLEEAHQLDLDRMLDRIAELEAAADAADTQRAHTLPPRDPAAPKVVDADEPPSLVTARGFAFQIDELRRTLTETRSDRDALKQRAAKAEALEAELNALHGEYGVAIARLGAVGTEAQEDPDEHVGMLEERLKERGQLVAKLQAELREGERVGRELLKRCLAAEEKLANGAAVAVPAVATEGLDAQIHALVQKCARHEADLEAARWQIAALEQQGGTNDANADHEKLEDALRAAREEIAELRREIVSRGERA